MVTGVWGVVVTLSASEMVEVEEGGCVVVVVAESVELVKLSKEVSSEI